MLYILRSPIINAHSLKVGPAKAAHQMQNLRSINWKLLKLLSIASNGKFVSLPKQMDISSYFPISLKAIAQLFQSETELGKKFNDKQLFSNDDHHANASLIN